MKLVEFLNTPLKWQKKSPGHYIFQYNEQNFLAKFELYDASDAIDPEAAMDLELGPDDQIADFTFGPIEGGQQKIKMTGKGGEIQIFSTIRSIVHDYASTNRHKVVGIAFFADTNEPTRVRLYSRMLPKIAKEINATPHNLGDRGPYHEFFLEFN
jgi:hypothetical protein